MKQSGLLRAEPVAWREIAACFAATISLGSLEQIVLRWVWRQMKRYCLPAHVTFQSIDGEVIAINFDRGTYHSMRGAAVVV